MGKNFVSENIFCPVQNKLLFGEVPSAPVAAKHQILDPGVIPKSLTSLEFGDKYNQVIGPGVLPESLISLEFSDEYKCLIYYKNIPKSLKKIKIGGLFIHF